MKFTVWRAGRKDLELLVSHRLQMWRDVHPEPSYARLVEDSEALTRRWIRAKMKERKLVGFIVKTGDGKVAGSGCVWVREEQPRPTNPSQVVPYLMSMYTEKQYRRKGVARLIVKGATKWCMEHKYERLVLHASDEGKPLYESLGFNTSNEMRLKL